MSKWDVNLSTSFWSKRRFVTVMRDDNLADKFKKYNVHSKSRQQLQSARQTEFATKFSQYISSKDSRSLPGTVIAKNLKFWIQHSSWSYCNCCKILKTERLLPSYFKRPHLKFSKHCTCVKNIYTNPTTDKIPEVLKGLSHNEVLALRPFTVHLGDYLKKQNGYRQKTNLFRLTWSTQSVLQKIESLPSPTSRETCSKAYDFLITNELSTYKQFVELRESAITQDKRFNVYDFSKNVGIECALWPNLYPALSFCETSLSGKENRASTKVAFITKVFSQISDYGTNFELLQFHYDLWLFKTVSGAITTARKKHCCPARSLEAKAFSSEFWKWQHRYLIDAVRQFGFPSLFITISPSEWSFPQPPWLNQLQELTGLRETELSAYETLHFVNTMEQLVRGYLCGSNDKAWKSHFFSHRRKSSMNNVLNYFYRFEFQKRGTVHMHLLVWLNSLQQIDLPCIRADIPWADVDSAYLVYNLQSSDKGSFNINEDDTNVESNNGVTSLNICHPAEAFAQNIRGYISTILPALQCRMDVQSSDGHGLLLKYVSSYVTKAHDAYHSESLYTIHVTPYEAAFRHLKQMAPLEPEMWLSMSSKKIAWTPHRVKRFVVPFPNTVSTNKIMQSYWLRPQRSNNLTLLQWLREMNTSKMPPSPYKKGKTLVATKVTSIFKDEYFFQYMLLNVPHRNPNKFHIPGFEAIPDVIKYFACALHHSPSLWMSETNMQGHFQLEGHRSWFVTNILVHIQSLKDLYHLWKKRVITFGELKTPTLLDHPLDPKQQLVLTLVQTMLTKRKQHYESIDCALDGLSSDSETETEDDSFNEPISNSWNQSSAEHNDTTVDWQKFLLVVGRAGSGKSYALTKVIQTCVTMSHKVFVATPTGFLATQYKDRFADAIDCDTIHAAFHYPVSLTERPSYNWSLSNYDLIVIDELSMVAVKVFEHILATVAELPIRPIILLAGDERQLPPIEKIHGKIQTTVTAMAIKELQNITIKVLLTEQYRNDHDKYGKFLDHIRFWRPSQTLLNKIQEGKVLYINNPTDDELLAALTNYPNSTVITVSHHASNRINKVVLDSILDKSLFLGYVNCDCDLGRIPVYKGMKVMITQNRNKPLCVVNGRLAHVVQMEGKTVFLKLANNTIVQLYPVSSLKDDGTLKTVVPFMPAYAITIPKAQGQTLKDSIVWLDSPVVAPGGAYVALSRCKTLDNIRFMTAIIPSQVTPVLLCN